MADSLSKGPSHLSKPNRRPHANPYLQNRGILFPTAYSIPTQCSALARLRVREEFLLPPLLPLLIRTEKESLLHLHFLPYQILSLLACDSMKEGLDCLTKGILPTRTHHRLIGSLPSAVLSLTLSYPIEDCYASYIMVFAVSPIIRIVLYAHHSYPREVLIDPSGLL